MDSMDDARKVEFITKAIEEICDRELKGTSTLERIAITIAVVKIINVLSGLPLRLKIKIITILNDYHHTADGLIKE